MDHKEHKPLHRRVIAKEYKQALKFARKAGLSRIVK